MLFQHVYSFFAGSFSFISGRALPVTHFIYCLPRYSRLSISFLVSIFVKPSTPAGYDTSSIFKRGLTGLNSEFSLSDTSSLTKAEEISLLYYLPIAGGRIIGFIPFTRVLVLCEIQSISSGFELVSPCPFPTTITITPRAPPSF